MPEAPRERNVKLAPVDTGAGSLTEARKYLEGRWTLESFEVHPPGKPVVTLKGQGTLTYDAFGNLAMEIRTDLATSDLLRAAGIDIRDGTISSSGRTAVDMQNRTLTYADRRASRRLAPVRWRRIVPATGRSRATTLTLTTKDDAGNATSVGRWRKIS